MKVAIVHYHLEPGGVTRVIENTLDAWASAGQAIETVVLSGRRYGGERIPNTQVIEGLDYATPKQAIEPELLMERMKDGARSSLGAMPDLWHVHNHSLGKNPALTRATALLAQAGECLLLHPHDFAEDGRPHNFKALDEVYAQAYPSSPRIHYAALNNRDRLFLSDLFANSASQVHLLANAIPTKESGPSVDIAGTSLPENLFLYPVRAVRRKNLGELALLAAAHPDKHFANSLGPTNPNFRPQFERWKIFAKESALPITYGLGDLVDCPFPVMVASSEAIVSTSVAEGFGLGFLEPWIFGKSLCGRNLPEITGDFSRHGVQLGNLYNRLELNLDLLQDPAALFPKIEAALADFFNDYGEELPPQASQEAYDSVVIDNLIDFGRLDEPLQEELISAVLESEEAKESIRDQSSIDSLSPARIKRNARVVQENFSMHAYGKKLIEIYQDLINAPVPEGEVDFAKGRDLLKQFLSPSRLNLLRTN
jgi:hypothetical protein